MPLWSSLSFASTVDDSDGLIVNQGGVFAIATRAQLRQQLDEAIDLRPTAGPSSSSPPLRLHGYNSVGVESVPSIQQDNSTDPGGLVIAAGHGGAVIIMYDNGQLYMVSGTGYLELGSILRSAALGGVFMQAAHAGQPAAIARAAAAQVANVQNWVDSSNAVMAAITKTGGIKLAELADMDAVNGTWYYSTDSASPAFKDSGGTVHALY